MMSIRASDNAYEKAAHANKQASDASNFAISVSQKVSQIKQLNSFFINAVETANICVNKFQLLASELEKEAINIQKIEESGDDLFSYMSSTSLRISMLQKEAEEAKRNSEIAFIKAFS